MMQVANHVHRAKVHEGLRRASDMMFIYNHSTHTTHIQPDFKAELTAFDRYLSEHVLNHLAELLNNKESVNMDDMKKEWKKADTLLKFYPTYLAGFG